MSTITGDTVFNDSNNNGTVNGTATFTGDGSNTGTVDGNAAFYDNSANIGEVTEAAAFLDEAQNNGEIGAECAAAPVITQHPQSIYVGNLGNIADATFSIAAEENPWIDIEWSIFLRHGYYSGSQLYVGDRYPTRNTIAIGTMLGGQPSDIWGATINCKLQNPFGEVHATEAKWIRGEPPALVLPPDFDNIVVHIVNITEGEPLIFVFRATSAADAVTVGATRGNLINDPIAFEGEFNTAFDVDSLVGRRKINLAYLNAGRAATREDHGVWRLKITDPIGATLSPYEITVNVTNVDVAPTITNQPVSTSGYDGETVTFTVEADDNVSGNNILSYQWQTSSGQNLEGQTLPSLNIQITPGSQEGQIVGSWRCNITSLRFTEGINTDVVSATSLGERPPPPFE
jgi:hypothetical protein